jgi:ATP-dependent exoDNAse (exonuclease V) alpha subunit
MQIENDYDREVCNGDIGFIAGIDVDEGKIVVRVAFRRSPWRCRDGWGFPERGRV